MYIVVKQKDSKTVDILDTKDGVIETISIGMAKMNATKLHINGIDAKGNITVTPMKTIIQTFLKEGKIVEAITCLPKYWEFEVGVTSKNNSDTDGLIFVSHRQYEFYVNQDRKWSITENRRSKSYRSGYDNDEIISIVLGIYNSYRGFTSIKVTENQ